MTGFIPFFIVLVAGLVLSGVLKKFHLPWVITLILAGILIGPHTFGIVAVDSTLTFLGDIGLIFLMFMAGLEVKFSSMRGRAGRGMWTIAIVNGLVPFGIGFGIAMTFGYSMLASLLVGTILMSSSVAVVIPILERTKLLHQKIGQWIIGSTAIQDITSLVIMAAVLRLADPDTALPLWLFYIIAIATFIIGRWVITRLWKLYIWAYPKTPSFEIELHSVVAILLGTVIIFELLGMHGIIAGFFAGMVLSEQITHKALLAKLHTIAYGIFIPVFFVVVGLQVDVGVFGRTSGLLLFAGLIIGGSIIGKYISGWVGGRISGLSHAESNLMGATSIPQLSTTLAAVIAGYELGVFNEEMIVVMTMLSVITTFTSPLVIEHIVKRMSFKRSDLVTIKEEDSSNDDTSTTTPSE